jgi:hypothetical protein
MASAGLRWPHALMASCAGAPAGKTEYDGLIERSRSMCVLHRTRNAPLALRRCQGTSRIAQVTWSRSKTRSELMPRARRRPPLHLLSDIPKRSPGSGTSASSTSFHGIVPGSRSTQWPGPRYQTSLYARVNRLSKSRRRAHTELLTSFAGVCPRLPGRTKFTCLSGPRSRRPSMSPRSALRNLREGKLSCAKLTPAVRFLVL